jgi:hypothetical protein
MSNMHLVPKTQDMPALKYIIPQEVQKEWKLVFNKREHVSDA